MDENTNNMKYNGGKFLHGVIISKVSFKRVWRTMDRDK